MKNKNPLYVIKGQNVMEAKNLFDLVIKKFGLEPFVEVLQNILKMLLEQVKSYHMLVMVKAIIDELMEKVTKTAQKFGMA